ncbi:MAG: hypothetical protein R3E10_10080 [Gemmatimonadota bacterium]
MAYNVHVLSMPGVDIDHLPQVDVDVDDLPPVDVASLPDLTITEIGPMGPLTLAGIPDRYTVAISAIPDLNLRIREIPQIRAHIPANFRLGISVLGVELAALHLCGEAQVITEPFQPNPCERCGTPPRTSLPGQSVTAVLRLQDTD